MLQQISLTLILIVTLLAGCPPAGSQNGAVESTAAAEVSTPVADSAVASDLPTSLQLALDWLRRQQRPDGAFGSEQPDASTTAAVVYAVALAGDDPAGPTWTPQSVSLLEALATLTPAHIQADHAGHTAKVLRAAVLAGQDPRDFGGADLIQRLHEQYHPDHGWSDGFNLFRHALAVEALARAGEPIRQEAIDFLLNLQQPDGGWTWRLAGGRSDVDTTGQIVISLVLAGLDNHHPSLEASQDYLRSTYRPALGWPTDGRTEALVNTNSTALAVRALQAMGAKLKGVDMAEVQMVLLRLQEADGAFRYSEPYAESRLVATLDVIPALVALSDRTDTGLR